MTSDYAMNNRRVAKNTAYLYVRMILIVAVGFFSTRLALQLLGAENYGLANVVGSAVTMFGFVMATMQIAALRFYNYELGRGDAEALRAVVSTTQVIFLLLAVLIALTLETVGLWVLKTKIVIPPGREAAAFWFYQLMSASFCFNILVVPFSSLVVAHEDMGIYAAISGGEAVLRFGMLFLLLLGCCDSLVLYGGILAALSALVFGSYVAVCLWKYAEAPFAPLWRRSLFLQILTFSGWNLWGAVANVLFSSWVNILVNNYCGVVVSAGKALATQINAMAGQFANNFLVSVNPQIIKYHAQGDVAHRDELVVRASKIGFFLYLLVALPVLLEMDFLLQLWLGDYPPHTAVFARLALVQLGIDVVSFPLMTLAQATGRIALYQTVIGGVLSLNFPFSWLALRSGAPPESVFWVAIAVSLLACVLRLAILRKIAGFPVWAFVRRVVARLALLVALLALAFGFLPRLGSPGLLRLAAVGGICLLVSALCIYFVGMEVGERRSFAGYVRARLAGAKAGTP
ncbi:MAG: lipopolysaccharide biosynthesis protein [Kiritimatiellia bacterium]